MMHGMRTSKARHITLTLALLLTLSGCSYLFPINPHKVPQGNTITDKQIAQLHVGMTKADVRETLGSSALDHLFDNDQWVYIYKQHHKQPRCQRLVLDFKGNKLSHFSKN